MYLIVSDYSSDAERKRIEYVFNKYESESGDVDKIKGTSRIVCDNDLENIISELYLRTSPEKIKVYKLTEHETKPLLESNKLEIEFKGKKENVEPFMGYLLAQRKAVFSRKIGDNIKKYISTTRKGYAEIKVGTFSKDDKIVLQIEVLAEEPNKSYLINYFTEQINLFNKSLSE